MNAPVKAFPLNPRPGQQYGQWMWTGSQWSQCDVSALPRAVVQVFNESGPYFPTAGMTFCTVETIGGGGGAGAVVGSALGGGNANTAGGGGSGGYSRKTLQANDVRGGVMVTIGLGGAGANAANGEGFGQPGQATSFGALCVSNGGSPGGSAGFGGNFSGGSGALPGVGDIAQLGCAGESGTAQSPPSNMQLIVHGGSGGTVWGGSSPGFDVGDGGTQNGNEGWPNTGAGGTGGACYNNTAPASGGQGGSGICIVTDYCLGPAGVGGDCGPGGPCVTDDAWPGCR